MDRIEQTWTWTVTVEAILGSEDLLLPIPKDLMARMGWSAGDQLAFNVGDDCDIPYAVLRKVDAEI